VVSLHRAGRLPPRYRRHLVGNELFIAFATAGELWKGALAAQWGTTRRGGLDLWLDQTAVLPADLRVAQTWGAIAATAQLRGRPRPQHDTWIAACCIKSGLPPVTLNRRDFVDFAEHDGLVPL
jgi:predicted nucleic acid-binding protein